MSLKLLFDTHVSDYSANSDTKRPVNLPDDAHLRLV